MKKIKNWIKNKQITDWIRYIITTVYIVLCIYNIMFLWLFVIALIIFLIVMVLSNMRLISQARGNGIIYGARGKGKGLLLNYLIFKDKSQPYCNVKYGKAEVMADVSEYLNSIIPLTTDDFINNTIDPIPKFDKYEKRNVYIDDVNVYMPNWNDSALKKRYPSMPPMLAINRHLYDAYCVVTTQDRERPYKILKELQSDFSIKAINSFGFGFFWNCIPILHYFVWTKYIYHELPKAVDMLPFSAKGLVNEVIKHGVLTAGQATKEVYEATNGIIRYGRCIQLKKYLSYDTRYFHQVVFGKIAPKP